MTLERKALAKALRRVDPARYRLELIGMKAVQLPPVQEGQYRGIILAGIAGGLAPGIANGDVVVESTMDLPTLATPHVNGPFFCSATVVPFADAKQALHEKTDAYAVEMESLAVRNLAIQHKLPMIHVRGISDSAEDDLNPVLMLLGDEFGRPRVKRVLNVLLAQPRLLGDMIALGKNANAAARAAALLVKEMIETL